MSIPPLPDFARAATANLVTHFTWIQERTPHMRVIRSDELVLTDCGLPCDTYNAVCGARLLPDRASDDIQAAIQHFKTANSPFSWWLSPDDQPSDLGARLLDAGLHEAESELAMAADLSRLPADDVPPDRLQIRQVSSAAALHDFATVVAANWTPPDDWVLKFYERAAPVLLDAESPLWLYVGYVGEKAAAASELTVGGGVVGLYNICTLASQRQQGFGRAMTLRPLMDAQAHGYTTAILQASEAGARVYRRLGFEPFGDVTEYKP